MRIFKEKPIMTDERLDSVAIIMDGNGRWAKQRGLPRTAGHAAGAESFRRIANYCRTLGVKYLTVYAFSTENWKRSQDEVAGIMKLLGAYLKEALADMEKNHVCFRFFGDLSLLYTVKLFCLLIHHFVCLCQPSLQGLYFLFLIIKAFFICP